jgi:hypothetical protein
MATITTGLTSLDVLKMNNAEELIGIIDDVIKTIPELGFFQASPMTDNSYETLVVLQDPKVGFRLPNTYGNHEVAVLGNRTVTCSYLDASWAMDIALASKANWGVPRVLALQTITHIRSAMENLSRQIWYGAKSDTNGFPGLYQLIGSTTGDTSNATLHIDGGGYNDDVDSRGKSGLTSVFAVSTGIDAIQMVWGQDGRITDSDVIKQWVANPANASNSGRWEYAQEISGWAGLQVTSQWAFGRINHISPLSNVTDDLFYDLLSRFPTGRKPQALFMNPRTLEQLRKSRTAVNATGAPAPIPDSIAGVPIYVTDAIVNNEQTFDSAGNRPEPEEPEKGTG